MPDTDLPPDIPLPADPDPGEHPTVVGIGASAGGLKALKEFFARVPADSGLAWVVVVHLSPEHESHLAQLLQPNVPFPVQQVEQTVRLEPDRVYVIPPGANLGTIDTHLRLTSLEERRRERAPIDHFFRTLARTHDGDAVGVILTGTGTDGTLGIREIKDKGGLAVVQDPAEAEYDGMPQSAIATGVVDLVLPVADIPGAILDFHRTEPQLPVPAREEDVRPEDINLLQRVFGQIRARTGRDFTRYKRSTILRRIARRMQLRRTEEFSRYVEQLRDDAQEVRALADDLLINVTSFFRDPHVFRALETSVIPALMEGRDAEDSVRVWSVGCATGEEAYSLAMLLLEEAARRDVAPRIQVFASDLHEQSLAKGREGFYPGDIHADVSEERLRRFFTKEDGGFRIKREVRELVVFSPHNLMGDPPFSRVDLVSCRNLLIYLDRTVQRDVVDLFHYALKPQGFLVLGTSETVDNTELFQVQDKPHAIYRRRDVPAPEPRLPVFPLSRRTLPGEPARQDQVAEPISYGALHHRAVERYGPPSILVSEDDRAVHLSEHAGRYLVHPGGEITNNAYKVVREELRIELRSAIHDVRKRRVPVVTRPVPVRFNGDTADVVMDVRPAPEPGREGYVLVVFFERVSGSGGELPERSSRAARVEALELELEAAKERLQGIIEEYETSQEELRASNEELQSSNEELRSTMEELETSKEELQSINEELQTVNQENRHKVEELSQLSGDLQNLLVATDIATLFLDRDLRILRFTPRVTELFNVRLVDRGRPVSDLTHRLNYDLLVPDARRVLDRLATIEREVRDELGRIYLARVLPYRSTDDRIEGVVVTFVDVTAMKAAEEVVRKSEERQAFLLELHDALRPLADPADVEEAVARLVLARFEVDRCYFCEIEGDEALIRRDRVRGDLRSLAGRSGLNEVPLFAPVVQGGRTLAVADVTASDEVDERVERLCLERDIHASLQVPVTREGAVVGVLSLTQRAPRAWTDLETKLAEELAERVWAAVERAKAEAALRESEGEFRALIQATMDTIYRMSADWSQMLRMEGGAFLPDTLETREGWLESYIPPEDQPEVLRTIQDSIRTRSLFELEHRVRRADGTVGWMLSRAVPLLDDEGEITRWIGAAADVTERREGEEALERKVEERTGEVRQLLAGLAQAEQAERERVSRLLHDDLQQLLFAAQTRLSLSSAAAAAGDAEEAALERDRSLELLDQAVERTRRLSADLNPPILEGEGLLPALEWLRTQMRDLHGLEVEIRCEHEVEVESTESRVLVFQAVRECLFNVAKHAGTESARVVVAYEDGRVRVDVADEGCGFDPDTLGDEVERGLGLLSARERLHLLGGEMEIRSSPGEGARVILRGPPPGAPS